MVVGAALGSVVVLLLVLVAAGVLPPASGSSSHPSPGMRQRPATAAEMRAAAARATSALHERDGASWDAALPAGPAVRRSVDGLYGHVATLPWTSVRLIAQPVAGVAGRFYVGVVGRLGDADPSDRIVARRVYDAVVRDGLLLLRADVTPRGIRGQQVMAFTRPIVVRRNGLVVVADAARRAAAIALARAGGPARKRLRLLGITSRRPVVVYYYASRDEMVRSLGQDPGEARVRFFSHPPIHLEETPTWTRDVGVLGPALAGRWAWAPRMLAHELTHAYTTGWFAGARHAPTLLAEGLATAVEGGRSFAPLRADLASGSSRFPLERALRAKSLWNGNGLAKVRLAYLEGSSLVLYVLHQWGLSRLKAFVYAVSDSDLTPRGLDTAARASLHVGWRRLRSGWSSYVRTLP